MSMNVDSPCEHGIPRALCRVWPCKLEAWPVGVGTTLDWRQYVYAGNPLMALMSHCKSGRCVLGVGHGTPHRDEDGRTWTDTADAPAIEKESPLTFPTNGHVIEYSGTPFGPVPTEPTSPVTHLRITEHPHLFADAVDIVVECATCGVRQEDAMESHNLRCADGGAEYRRLTLVRLMVQMRSAGCMHAVPTLTKVAVPAGGTTPNYGADLVDMTLTRGHPIPSAMLNTEKTRDFLAALNAMTRRLSGIPILDRLRSLQASVTQAIQHAEAAESFERQSEWGSASKAWAKADDCLVSIDELANDCEARSNDMARRGNNRAAPVSDPDDGMTEDDSLLADV